MFTFTATQNCRKTSNMTTVKIFRLRIIGNILSHKDYVNLWCYCHGKHKIIVLVKIILQFIIIKSQVVPSEVLAYNQGNKFYCFCTFKNFYSKANNINMALTLKNMLISYN